MMEKIYPTRSLQWLECVLEDDVRSSEVYFVVNPIHRNLDVHWSLPLAVTRVPVTKHNCNVIFVVNMINYFEPHEHLKVENVWEQERFNFHLSLLEQDNQDNSHLVWLFVKLWLLRQLKEHPRVDRINWNTRIYERVRVRQRTRDELKWAMKG